MLSVIFIGATLLHRANNQGERVLRVDQVDRAAVLWRRLLVAAVVRESRLLGQGHKAVAVELQVRRDTT